MQPYLENSFLDRVRRSYRSAIAVERKPAGSIWSPINDSRADIHSALLAEENDRLRQVFIDPAATDLFHGIEGELCRTRGSAVGPEAFMKVALEGARTKFADAQMLTVASLLARSGWHSVVEIGPGMGRLALASVKFGITDYTTIDLPLGVVAQACFLARALGPDKLWFDGEPDETATGKIKMFSAGRLPDMANYGLAINVDSMTEMPWRTAFDYAQWLGRRARLFLSVNHRSNVFSIATLMAFAGAKRLSCRHCHPIGYGTHLDYAEEVFAPREFNLPHVRREAFHFFIAINGRLGHYLGSLSGNR